ncbi:MAG: peptide chain release factor N(5)-glutamine methyltransferase [Chloroflexota bacterium]
MNKTSLHSDITTRLAAISDTPDLDASVLIAHVLNKPRTWVMAHPELTLNPDQQKQLDVSLTRLEKEEPFPYILGHWEFFGLDFDVTPDVLIPRPETELLVEKAIIWLQESKVRRTIADIGTGSGAIAVSLAVNVPDADILATDISPQALQVAKRNAKKLGVENRIEFIECDLLPNKHTFNNNHLPFDLICANLPYIPTQTLSQLSVFGREPTVALDGGADGLDLIRRLLNLAPDWLAPNALILLEIEATLGMKALGLVSDLLSQAEIHLHQDLTGRDRLLEIRL